MVTTVDEADMPDELWLAPPGLVSAHKPTVDDLANLDLQMERLSSAPRGHWWAGPAMTTYPTRKPCGSAW